MESDSPVRWLTVRAVCVAVFAACMLLDPATIRAAEADATAALRPLGEGAVGQISAVFGDSDRPKPGDVLRAGRFVLRIDGGGPLDLASDEEGEVLFRRLRGAPPVPVAVTVKERYWNGKRESREDPLSRMDQRQLRQLQGVRFEVWDAAAGAALARLDLSHVCVAIEVRERASAWPALPSSLRCLAVEGAFETRDLSRLSKLEWLDFYGDVETQQDLAPLAGLANLRWLRVWEGRHPLRHAEALGSLRRLRWLDLGNNAGVVDLSFVSRLAALEFLDVASTGVSDLGPLGSLPALRQVDASRTRATRLPSGECPALRELNVLSTAVEDDAVAVFRRAHPHATVWRRWNETLRTVLAGVDGLRVRTERIDSRVLDFVVAYEEKDRPSIERVISWLQVEEPESWWHCGCLGSPWLEFTRAGRSVATISFHHGQSIRWQEGPPGWPGDAALEPRNAAVLVDWLAAHGVTGPRDEIRASTRREEEESRKTERMTAGMSQQTKAAFMGARTGWVSFTPSTSVGADGESPVPTSDGAAEPPHPFAVALVAEQPDESRRILTLLAMFGTDNGSWSQLGWQEQIVEELLNGYCEKALQNAVEAALTGEDRRARRGAARFWTASRSRLGSWRPPGEAALRGAVLDVMMQARYAPLRQRAAELLAAWSKRIGASEAERRLALLLRDPASAVRSRAMLVAGQQRWSTFEEDLLGVLSGTAFEPISLQPVPPEEEEATTEEGRPDASNEAAVAALALGYMSSEKARPALAKMAGSTAAARVSLALLGEGDRLQASDFGPKEGTDDDLRRAAETAVLRFHGRQGLPALLEAARMGYRSVEESEVAAIKAMLKRNSAPGLEQVKAASRATDLQAWYSAYGREYVRRVSKLQPDFERQPD